MSLAVQLAHAPGDRRSGYRFPVEAKLRYLLLKGKTIVAAGYGKTINISSSGLLFQSKRSLEEHQQIEISMAWPARINGSVGMQLRVSGETVRMQGDCTAVRIAHHEFHTCGVHRSIAAEKAIVQSA